MPEGRGQGRPSLAVSGSFSRLWLSINVWQYKSLRNGGHVKIVAYLEAAGAADTALMNATNIAMH